MTDRKDFTAEDARAILEDAWGYYTPERDTKEEQEPDLFDYANAA